MVIILVNAKGQWPQDPESPWSKVHPRIRGHTVLTWDLYFLAVDSASLPFPSLSAGAKLTLA